MRLATKRAIMDSQRLSAGGRRQLVALLRRTSDVRQYRRTLAILEFGSGKTVAEIAHMLQTSRQSVYNWIEHFRCTRTTHGLVDAPRSGRPPCWGEEAEALLQNLLQGSPQLQGYWATQWTVPLLQEQLRHCLGEQYCGRTVRRSLHRLGYVWKRARYVLMPDPEREKKTPDSARRQW